MNAQTDAPAQALMLFVASYKNCSSCDTYRSAFHANPPALRGFGQLAQSLLYPLASADSALLQGPLPKGKADDQLAYRV